MYFINYPALLLVSTEKKVLVLYWLCGCGTLLVVVLYWLWNSTGSGPGALLVLVLYWSWYSTGSATLLVLVSVHPYD